MGDHGVSLARASSAEQATRVSHATPMSASVGLVVDVAILVFAGHRSQSDSDEKRIDRTHEGRV